MTPSSPNKPSSSAESIGEAAAALMDACMASDSPALHRLLATEAGRAALHAPLPPGHRLRSAHGHESATPLGWAIDQAWDAGLAAMLLAGADPNGRRGQGSPRGWRPLSHALRMANDSTVNLLLDAGADPHAPDCDGFTPLHNAATRSSALLRLLLDSSTHWPDIDSPTADPHHGTALSLAASLGPSDGVEALLARGADVHALLGHGRSALHCAVSPMMGDGLRTVELLISHGADIGHEDAEGMTPLMKAIAHGGLETAMALLRAGEDPRRMTSRGGSAVGMSASRLAEKNTHPVALAAMEWAKRMDLRDALESQTPRAAAPTAHAASRGAL